MSRRFKPAKLIWGAIGIVIVLAFVLIFQRSIGVRVQREGKMERTGTEASNEMPPDLKAFYSTYGIREPEKRLEALEKFIKEFPGSSQIKSAKRETFKVTIKIWPDDRTKMLNSANRLLDEAGPDVISRSSQNQFIARELFAAEIFLDEAETFALKSLEGLNKEQFIEDQKKQYAEWKRALPPEDVMSRKYASELAAYRTTLGRIYLKKGNTAEGEKILKEAYAVDPAISQAAIGLAEIAEKKGEDAAALDYLTTATLTAGHSMADTRSRLETLYRKTHDDSINGLESRLDARYAELFSNPIKVEHYVPTVSRSSHVVLAEFFTGAG